MKVSEHPAIRARQQRDPVFRASEDETGPDMIQPENIGDAELPSIQQLQGEPDDWQPPEPEPGETGTGDLPQPTREPIVTAPRDGRDLIVYWDSGDADGRLVRWREGRRFNGRRWVPGGAWAPADTMALPLPAVEPVEWLRMPGDEPPPGEPAEAEQAAA